MLEAAGERDDGAERSDLLESVTRWMQLSLMLGIVLIGALCFALGASLRPPTVAGAPAQSVRATKLALLTVFEQKVLQALCVEVDRQKTEVLRAKAGS